MLEHLNLRTCVKVTDGGLIAYAGEGEGEEEGEGGKEDEQESSVLAVESFPSLITLNLAGLPGITIAGVSVLAHKFTRLSRLEITGCASIERRDLRRLVSNKCQRCSQKFTLFVRRLASYLGVARGKLWCW